MSKVINIVNEKPLLISEKEDANIMIIIDSNKANISYEFKGGNYNIFIYRKSKNLDLRESAILSNETNLNISYLDLEDNDLIQNSAFTLNARSVLNLNSIYLGSKNKDINFDITNKGAHSEAYVSNSIVALKDSDLKLNVIGNIVSGAKSSIHHQKSRCLTIDSLTKALIRPVLNIDENDVVASHSLSSGTIDDEVLYYMNARGLDKNSALLLMIESYLSFETSLYKLFDGGENIEEENRKKVKSLCLM